MTYFLFATVWYNVPSHLRWLDEGPTVRCSNLFSMHPHPLPSHERCLREGSRHEGSRQHKSLPLTMILWWIGFISLTEFNGAKTGKTKEKEKLGQRAYCRFEKQKHGHQTWLVTSFVFRNYFSHVVFTHWTTGLTRLTHLVALVLPWIWWTAFFSRPWNPRIGCATSWRTGKSWRRWWWPLWQETSFVRCVVVWVRVRWWLGLRLGLKEFPQKSI